MCKCCEEDKRKKSECIINTPIVSLRIIKNNGLNALEIKSYNREKQIVDNYKIINHCPLCRKEAGRVIVLGIVLMILLIGMLAILEYNQGCKDTERAYQTRSCDKCANWKTINCPNSSKCFSTTDKPYFKIKEDK